MKKELKERLKYYHIYCLNCGCKVLEFNKNDKGFIDLWECPDCKDKIKIYFHQTMGEIKPIFLSKNAQVVVIKCTFLDSNYVCSKCRSLKNK